MPRVSDDEVKNLLERFDNARVREAQGTCPDCGAPLVPMSGTPDFEGDKEAVTMFMGCPKCEATQESEKRVRSE